MVTHLINMQNPSKSIIALLVAIAVGAATGLAYLSITGTETLASILGNNLASLSEEHSTSN